MYMQFRLQMNKKNKENVRRYLLVTVLLPVWQEIDITSTAVMETVVPNNLWVIHPAVCYEWDRVYLLMSCCLTLSIRYS